MKTLSGRQPWWWAILHAGKRVENRRMIVRGVVRPPTWHAYRGPILLHAAKGCTAHEFSFACNWMEQAGVVSTTHPMILDDLPRGGIVGRARIVDVITPQEDIPPSFRRPYAEGVDGRWHMPEQYGFVLADVEPLPFYPCQGSLGLWELDESRLAA